MKKTLLYIWILLSVVLLGACQGQSTDLTTQEPNTQLEDTFINEVYLESMAIDSETIRNDYTIDSFSLDGIHLILSFNDETEISIDLTESMIEQDLSSITEAGTYTFDVTYLSKETSFSVVIEDSYDVIAIDVKHYNPYALISVFNISDLYLTLTLDNSATKEIPLSYDMIDDSSINKLFIEGIQEITVEYEGFQTSFIIYLFKEYPTPETLELSKDEAIFYEVLEILQNYHYSNPDKDELYRGALNGLISSLNDPYTNYHDQESYEQYTDGLSESYVGLGVYIQIIDNTIVITGIVPGSPAEEAGLMTDDIIRIIDGHNVTQANASEMVYTLLGEIGETITIEIERPGIDTYITYELEYRIINTPSVSVDHVLDGNDKYGIITVNSFGSETANLFKDAIESLEEDSLKGMVIDLRNNSGGYLSAVLSMLQNFLLDDGKPLFTFESYANGFDIDIFYGRIDEIKPYDIVVLVNENSASASEVFAVSMQEHGNYQVIGTTTYGKGVGQTIVAIDEKPGDYLIVTNAKWFSPLGNWVDKSGDTPGVTPDIIVEKNELESLWKIYLAYDEVIAYDTVDERLERIQIILNGMGYNLRTDGYYDDATKLAIEDIQSNNGLTVTGDINQNTVTIINDWLEDYQANTDTQLDKALEILENMLNK